VPLNSAENKSNIANFFSKTNSPSKPKLKEEMKSTDREEDINMESCVPGKRKVEELADDIGIKDEGAIASKARLGEDETVKPGLPVKTPMRKPTKRGPPTPTKKSRMKKEAGSKITNFFAVK